MTKVQKNINFVSFGERVRFIRENILKLTQTELAEKINTHKVLLSRLKKGIAEV